jgi:hypothetical protein
MSIDYGVTDISGQIRPGKKWYLVALVIAVLSIIGGFVVFSVGLRSAAASVDANFRFTSTDGKDLTQTLTPGDYRFYTRGNDAISSKCGVTVPEPLPLTDTDSIVSFRKDGKTWAQAGRIKVATAGSYTFGCTGQEFALGDPADTSQFGVRLGSAFGALAGLPCLGITLSGILAMVVTISRGRSRARLLSAQVQRATHAAQAAQAAQTAQAREMAQLAERAQYRQQRGGYRPPPSW